MLRLAAGAVAGAALGLSASTAQQRVRSEAADGHHTKQEERVFTRQQVAQHNSPGSRVWVTYQGGVYDVTQFLHEHPGGAKRLLDAAGGPLEPFWSMYPQHHQPYVQEVLQPLRIGRLADSDAAGSNSSAADSADAYSSDPKDRDPALVTRSSKPFTAEAPRRALATRWLTPNNQWYVRNHLPVPEVDPSEYRLHISVEGDGSRSISLSLDDLRKRYPAFTVPVTLQCAGNRRNDMNRVRKVKGGSWELAAISNATWTGARLRDVLADLGVPVDHVHVHFEGLDHDDQRNYGMSIPIEKAMDPRGDVLLAYEMNGEPIPRDHGYPVRAVVPGYIGARSVKWLGAVRTSRHEHPGHWQRNDYKSFGPTVLSSPEYAKLPPINDSPVQSAVCEPAPGASVQPGSTIDVRGYAWSGGGRGILRVEVSPDGGQSWHAAALSDDGGSQPDGRAWAWRLFHARVPVPLAVRDGETVEIMCRAVDTANNSQPERVEQIWNMRGLVSNAWHRVPVIAASLPRS